MYDLPTPSTAPQPTEVLGLQASAQAGFKPVVFKLVTPLPQSSEYLGGEFHHTS